jgi:hypothetical protein
MIGVLLPNNVANIAYKRLYLQIKFYFLRKKLKAKRPKLPFFMPIALAFCLKLAQMALKLAYLHLIDGMF